MFDTENTGKCTMSPSRNNGAASVRGRHFLSESSTLNPYTRHD
jgi:hypothetical protein